MDRAFVCSFCFVIICSPSHLFGALGRLCFVIVAFPGYLHLYSDNSSFFLVPWEGCAS